MSDRGCDKDGELKSERGFSSKSGCYKDQDSGQVFPFGVDQGLTHETSVIIDNVSDQVRGASQLEIDHALIHWAKSRTLPGKKIGTQCKDQVKKTSGYGTV